jgi:hypothetical protein
MTAQPELTAGKRELPDSPHRQQMRSLRSILIMFVIRVCSDGFLRSAGVILYGVNHPAGKGFSFVIGVDQSRTEFFKLVFVF